MYISFRYCKVTVYAPLTLCWIFFRFQNFSRNTFTWRFWEADVLLLLLTLWPTNAFAFEEEKTRFAWEIKWNIAVMDIKDQDFRVTNLLQIYVRGCLIYDNLHMHGFFVSFVQSMQHDTELIRGSLALLSKLLWEQLKQWLMLMRYRDGSGRNWRLLYQWLGAKINGDRHCWRHAICWHPCCVRIHWYFTLNDTTRRFDIGFVHCMKSRRYVGIRAGNAWLEQCWDV